MTTTQLDRAAVAARYGIQPQTVTIEVRRGSLPKPDGYIGRSPWWWSTTLDGWTRPGRAGRPPKDDTMPQRQVPAGRARPGRETVQGTELTRRVPDLHVWDPKPNGRCQHKVNGIECNMPKRHASHQ